jgi:hypothetical protein
MGIGWPEQGPDGAQRPRWSTIDRFWPNFTGGEFHHSLEEGVIGGAANRGYIFRFEAQGYAPFVTRVYRADEGEVALDIKLHQAEETLVAVYTANGQPAGDAQVGLLAPGSNLNLARGCFSTMGSMGSTWLRKTDAQGQFLLPKDEAVQRIAIAHPEGYLECSAAELHKSRSVRLRAWARLEGIWLEDGRPAANREVSLQFNRKTGAPVLDLEFSSYHSTTDENGRFVFTEVPSGLLDIVTWQNSVTPDGPRFGSHVLEVQTRLGETSQVTVGSTNQVRAAADGGQP